jgi:lysophospholipase L1-like esterase
MLCRAVDAEQINMGFSGSARGEDAIAAYVRDLSMSLFVYDYDYNAPTVEHLANTHERMFRTIREAQPELPVIMMSRAHHILSETDALRRTVVETTYKNALAAGDKNVYFLDGAALTALCKNEGTVDGVHPTDFGFVSMASALEKLIRENRIIPVR